MTLIAILADLEDAPEFDLKPRSLSKVAQRLLFLLGPIHPNTQLGFDVVIARENELRTEDVARAMRELKDLGITYQSRYDPQFWYTSQDVDAGLRLVQLPEGVPPLVNEAERDLAKQYLKSREHGVFTENYIAQALALEGKQSINLTNILQHLRSLGLVARFPVENGNDLWTIIRDPGEQPRTRSHTDQATASSAEAPSQDTSTSATDLPTRAMQMRAAMQTDTIIYSPNLSPDNLDNMFSYFEGEAARQSDDLVVPPMEGRSTSRSNSLDTFDRRQRSEEPLFGKSHKGKVPAIIQQDEPTPSTSLAKGNETVAGRVHFEDNEVTHPRPTSPDHEQPIPIPPGARWTKINKRLVNSQALEEAGLRFEERAEDVIVLRVLTRDEIQRLAERTAAIRSLEPRYEIDVVEGEERGQPRLRKGKREGHR